MIAMVIGFAIFVSSSEDDKLRASVDDANCPWPYSSGTLSLEYRWGSGLTGSNYHVGWRAAVEDSVDSWNDLSTNVEWEYDGSGVTAFGVYNSNDGRLGYNQPYCAGGYNGIRTSNVTWGNLNYEPHTFSKRQAIAGHELGHAMGLFHSTNDGDLMYGYCCPTDTPTSNDEAAVNALY